MSLRLPPAAILISAITWVPAAGVVRAQDAPAPAPPTATELQALIARQQELIEQQGRQITELRARLEQLESRTGAQAGSPPPAPAATPAPTLANADNGALPELPARGQEDVPGSLELTGSRARLRVGGQVRTLLVRNFGAVGTEDRFVTSSIPVEGTPEADKTARTTLSPSPTRFNLDLRTPTRAGTLRAFVEGDFAGAGRTYRLRHAFGQWHGLLAGQTWSTFSDPEAEPDGIDFEGLNAISLFRQAQLRFTRPLWDRVEFAVAIENPSPDITGATGVNQVPDVVVRLRFEPRERGLPLSRILRGGGHIQAAYLVRQIRGEPSEGGGRVLSTGGTGYHVSGRIPAPWRTSDFVMFATALGPGIGRYITDLSSAGGQDAVYDASTSSLKALFAQSYYVGYEHWWTATLRSTGTFGFVRVRNLDVQSADALHETTRGSVNIAWSPIPRVDLVTELLTGRRVNRDGREGQASQAQIGWTFRF